MGDVASNQRAEGTPPQLAFSNAPALVPEGFTRACSRDSRATGLFRINTATFPALLQKLSSCFVSNGPAKARILQEHFPATISMKLSAILFVTVSILLSACGRSPQSPKSNWHVDVRKLEIHATVEPSEKVFLERIRTLYEAIRDRDWNTVYSMRTANFRRAVSAEMFTKEAKSLNYTFSGYDVLKTNDYITPDEPVARRLIVRFRINGRENFNVIWWVNEGDTWYVENLRFEILGFPFEAALGGPIR